MLLVKMDGNVGGVRGGKVTVGCGVSVGRGVGVTMPAMAVPTAWVMRMFMSGVGEVGVAGLHAAKITASRPKARKMREDRNIRGYFTNNHMFSGGLLTSGELREALR